LLASYEIERRQVGERNVAASRYASLGRRTWRAAYRPNIRDNTPEGAETRAALIRIANIEQRKSNEMIGAELGYRYVDSPIIWPEPAEGPAHNYVKYVPTTWPGARLPHVWLKDGTAIHDHIDSNAFTVLQVGSGQADTAGLERAFAQLGAPLLVTQISDQAARDIYGYELLLLRPDLHVVWRGNSAPGEPDQVAAVATGQIAARPRG